MSYCRGGGGNGRRLPGVDTDGTFDPFELSTSSIQSSYANAAIYIFSTSLKLVVFRVIHNCRWTRVSIYVVTYPLR